MNSDRESLFYFETREEETIGKDELDSFFQSGGQYADLIFKHQLIFKVTEEVYLIADNVKPQRPSQMIPFKGHLRGLETMFHCVLPIDEYNEEYYLRLIGHLEEAHAYLNHAQAITEEQNRLAREADYAKTELEELIAEFSQAIETNNREFIEQFTPKTEVLFPICLWEASWQRGFGVVQDQTVFDYQTELSKKGGTIGGCIVDLKGAYIRPSGNPQFTQKWFERLEDLPDFCTKTVTISSVKVAAIPNFPVLNPINAQRVIHKNTIHYYKWQLTYGNVKTYYYYYQEEAELDKFIQRFEELFVELDSYSYRYEILEDRYLEIKVPDPNILS